MINFILGLCYFLVEVAVDQCPTLALLESDLILAGLGMNMCPIGYTWAFKWAWALKFIRFSV